MTADQPLCSTAARLRAEPLAGSAPVARRWLLIEHPGPWARDPVATPPLAGLLGERLAAAARAADGRILLIRRAARRPQGRRAWYAVDIASGRWVTGTWEAPEDLAQAAVAVGEPLSRSTERADPLLLVCTHGTRDTCCAVRGRPIATALSALWPDEVWECTHLGGHRFSGTLLSLPDGACYGGLDADTAAGVVGDHRAGRVRAAHLRGMTAWPPAVQAAQAWALDRFGPAALGSVGIGSVEEIGDGVTRVEVLGRGAVPALSRLTVTRDVLPPTPLSCGAAPGEHAAYRVVPV